MITEVKVEGADELRRAIRETGDKDLAKSLRAANKTAAEIVAEAAIPHVPVGATGGLQRSIKAIASQTSGKVKAGSPARVPYAAAIHWGEGTGNINHTTGATLGRPERNIQGRPFLWEAADRMLRQVIETYEGEIDELLDKAVRNR